MNSLHVLAYSYFIGTTLAKLVGIVPIRQSKADFILDIVFFCVVFLTGLWSLIKELRVRHPFNKPQLVWLLNGSIKTLLAIYCLTPLNTAFLNKFYDGDQMYLVTYEVRLIGLLLILAISEYNMFYKERVTEWFGQSEAKKP